MTVYVYVDTGRQVGDPEHLKIFAGIDDADTWLKRHDSEGVASAYEVIGTSETKSSATAR